MDSTLINKDIRRIDIAIKENAKKIGVKREQDEVLKQLNLDNQQLTQQWSTLIIKSDKREKIYQARKRQKMEEICERETQIGITEIRSEQATLKRERNKLRKQLRLASRTSELLEYEEATQPVLGEPEDTDYISEEISALRRIRQEATISICKIQSVEETMCGWASRKHHSEPEQCEDTYTLIPIDEW